jgi:hypothetical protein
MLADAAVSALTLTAKYSQFLSLISLLERLAALQAQSCDDDHRPCLSLL